MPDTTVQAVDPTSKPRHRPSRWLIGLGFLVLVIVALILFWNWDWFIPIVQSRASAALGRPVTITHLHVKLGRVTTVSADGVTIANPDGFPQQQPLAQLDRLTIATSVMDYIHTHTLVFPLVEVDKPVIAATALQNGDNNFTIKMANNPPPANAKPTPPPQIGDLRINDGTARFIDPKFKSDFALSIATRAAEGNQPSAIVVNARGKYAGQPLTGRFVGGALLNLRDAEHPYPIDLRLENGPTKVVMVGAVRNPMNFAGARVKLQFSGSDMSLLFPLTGIPIPQTPPFSITGNVDYTNKRVRFTDFAGRVGSSDLNGNIEEYPGIGSKPDVTMDLWSHRLDLTDLGGFVGTPAGKQSTPGQTTTQKRELAKAEASKTLLPSTPINMPKLRAANIHLKYRGEHIENRATPFDNITVALDVVDGRVTLHPLDFGVGGGKIASDIDLDPGPHDIIAAKADVKFQHINITRVMQATHAFKGDGIIGGEIRIDTHGNSAASMMGQGNGEAKLILLGGGNLSALLVDISGLQFGNAILSALGVPNRAKLQCFVADMPLNQGVLSTKVFLIDSDEGRITGDGTINFRDQTLDYAVTTRSKHFSIGSLPGPVNLTGPLGSPSIRPGAETIARAGGAAALGVLLTPLGALLPTIQFGVGDDNACTQATAEEKQPLRVKAPPRRRAHK